MKSTQHPFGSMEKPEIHLPEHQRRLKRILLSHRGGFSFHSMFLSRFVPIAGLAFAFIFTLSVTQQPDSAPFVPSASAQEIVQDSIEQLQALSPQELSELEAQLGTPELVALFQEALHAQDLNRITPQTISCEEAREVDDTSRVTEISTVKDDSSCAGAATLSWKDAKILLTSSQEDLSDLPISGATSLGFTRLDGTPAVMILDEELLPSFTLSF